MRSHKSRGLRTVDVARRTGYSVQQIRNLERDGVLPPALRTATGYRIHDDSHVLSALAYRRLAEGIGPVEAKRLVRAAHTPPPTGLLELLDAAHARLDTERRDLSLAVEAARSIADEPIGDVLPTDALTVSELAGALGVRASTLRYWDEVGLVVPHRATPGGARRYAPQDARDARIVHQLRLAGYRIPALQSLLPDLRSAGGHDEMRAGLTARRTSIDARSRALFDGAAALSSLVTSVPTPDA